MLLSLMYTMMHSSRRAVLLGACLVAFSSAFPLCACPACFTPLSLDRPCAPCVEPAQSVGSHNLEVIDEFNGSTVLRVRSHTVDKHEEIDFVVLQAYVSVTVDS
jgi:hypothetical protein